MPLRPPAGFISAFYNPLQVPNAPTIGTATGGVDGAASVAFTAPTNVGGSAISAYYAVSNPSQITASAASSPISVTGLTNGTAYTFQVWALNTYGPSAYSATSNSVTPVANTSWVAKLGSSANAEGVAIDSDRNVYVIGGAAVSGQFRIGLTKYDTFGNIQWQKLLSDSNYAYGYAIALDSSNNVCIAGAGGSNSSQYAIVIAKYNTSGTLLWQRKLAGGAGQSDEAFGIAVDSSNNIYVSGRFRASFNNNDVFIAKYDSSGTIQWQNKLSGGADISYALTIDSTGNPILSGVSNNAGSDEVLIAKYDSAGTVQFQKRITIASGWSNLSASGIALDSNNNIYIVGDIYGSNTSFRNNMYVAKLDSTGSSVLWDRKLNSSSNDDYGRGIAVDLSGNVYITGRSFQGTGSQQTCQIVKYNTDGTLQWQRFIERTTTGTNDGFGIKTDAIGNYYVVGTIGSGDNYLIAKLPADGSKTGTYTLGGQTIQYAASSMTSGSVGRSTANASLTSGSAGMTATTPSLTDSTSTFTSSVVTI